MGSGGIVIGQAAEFDYSGSQALKAMREEGIETILVNPNIATIQTSLRMADKVYLEPIIPDVVSQIVREERPDGILLGFGGQTALNVGWQLGKFGLFEKENVRVLGSSLEAIEITEDRLLFKEAMDRANVSVPLSDVAYDTEGALQVAKDIGYPIIIRTAFMLGGGGSGIAYNPDELREIADLAFPFTITHQVLVEKYLDKWKELEYEIMRDHQNNTIVVAGLENLDPMGIHTGDSIVVSPTQTLTNREFQMMRSASIRVIREVGIIGECNIQFALDPKSKDFVAIEVNPRMSRSSALASKATGYPLAYIAAKLAIGYSLTELPNKVTGVTTACFEPALDYLVVKIPRWDFQKFPGFVDRRIGPMMKSVGEVMSIARCFEEALQKAVRGLEIGKIGLVCNPEDDAPIKSSEIEKMLKEPTDERLFILPRAMKAGFSIEDIYRLSGIDPWFLYKIQNIVRMEDELRGIDFNKDRGKLRKLLAKAKELGFSDLQVAECLHVDELRIRGYRIKEGVVPRFKIVDTMAAEWESKTNYCYATYGDSEDDVDFTSRKSKVIVLGAGCIRIGSSVEFDYCTMNTAWAMKDEGIQEIIVINNNPETVSTDYDMSDKLYFEELTLERVLDIVDAEKPIGVVVSVGGQTSNNLALKLAQNGVRILGTSAENIDKAEDRSKFSSYLDHLGIPQPNWKSLTSIQEIKEFAKKIGYPTIVRPSYVLSGAAMRVAGNEEELVEFVKVAAKISRDYPVVVSKFIQGAKEVEVDAVSDGRDILIGAIIEHIELAGTHSGDATMIIPPQTLTPETISTIEDYTIRISRALGIRGPFNIQFIIKDGEVYILELNLRASRSIPFTSKATGIPLIQIAAKVMLGKTLRDLNCLKKVPMFHTAVKSPTFSFVRLRGADPTLGVEMTSTGEVACFDYDFPVALIKSLVSGGLKIPRPYHPVLITVRKEDHKKAASLAKRLQGLHYEIYATEGTANAMIDSGLKDIHVVNKIGEGEDNVTNFIVDKKPGLVINVPSARRRTTVTDGYRIRRAATEMMVPVITQMETAEALVSSLEKGGLNKMMRVRSLNEYISNSQWAREV